MSSDFFDFFKHGASGGQDVPLDIDCHQSVPDQMFLVFVHDHVPRKPGDGGNRLQGACATRSEDGKNLFFGACESVRSRSRHPTEALP